MERVKVNLYRPRNLLHWLALYCLYLEAFPACERKPFSIICRMFKEKRADVWCCECRRRFIGFATTINSEDVILLDYFAVRKDWRGRGIGTEILKSIIELYDGRGFLVEIESEYEDVPNKAERQRRKHFYMRNGLRPLNVMAYVFGTKMELLAKDCAMSFEDYYRFYLVNYSPRAAENIIWAEHPGTKT